MNREQLMKMSKKELKARLVTVGKEAQDKSGEELTALMDEARTCLLYTSPSPRDS